MITKFTKEEVRNMESHDIRLGGGCIPFGDITILKCGHCFKRIYTTDYFGIEYAITGYKYYHKECLIKKGLFKPNVRFSSKKIIKKVKKK